MIRFLLTIVTLLSFIYLRAEGGPYFSNPENRARIFLQITNIEGEYEMEESFFDSLLEVSDSEEDQLFSHIGLAWFYRNNNPDGTTKEITQAKTLIGEHTNLEQYQGYLCLTEAKAYRHFGQLEKSLKLLQKAVDYFESENNLAMELIARSQLNLTLTDTDRLTEALQNHTPLLEQAKSLDSTKSLHQQLDLYLLNQYSTILTILSAKGMDSLMLASPTLLRVIDYATRLQHGYILSNSKGNLAYVYMQEGQYEKALELARVDLNYSLKAGRMASTAHLYYMMARIHFGLENMDSTAFYINETKELLHYFSEPILLNEFADLSLNYYKKTGNLEEAYLSLKNQLTILDELYMKKSKTDFDLLKAQTDLENVEQDLEALQLKNVIQSRMAILLIILLIVVTLLLAYIIRQSALQRMQNKQLETLNNTLEEEVQKRTQKIMEQNLRIKEIAFRNSHNTRAPVARLLGMAELLKLDQRDNKDELFDKIIDSAREIDEVIHEMNSILNESKSRD